MADFYLLGNSSHAQMFGCVIKTETKTVVFDGGTTGDYEQLAAFLKEKAGGHVDAWFFTHPHHDHMGCFAELRRAAPAITVDKIYHCFPPIDLLLKHVRVDWERTLWEDIAKWDLAYDVGRLSAGNRFSFDGVTVRVLRVFNPDITENFINNSSAVFRIEGKKSSFLILGDLGVEGGDEVLKTVPLPLLEADYTQMAHHGQNGVDRRFYEAIRPKRCIWPAPGWLWNNDAGGGFDTGPFQTLQTRAWMADLGVTQHFIEKDGTQRIPF